MNSLEERRDNPYQAPAMDTVIMPEKSAEDQIMESLGLGDPKVEAVHRGHKTAAIAMIVNALFGLVALPAILQFGPSVTALSFPVAAIIDLALGIAILMGYFGVLGFVKFRVFAGLFFFSLWSLSDGAYLGVVFQVMYCGSLLALILGRPGIVRFVFGTIGVSLCVLLSLFGAIALLINM